MTFRFVPYPALGDMPNVVVDGAAQGATVLTLSHWSHSGTPAELKDDLSAQIVFHYLDHPRLHVNADAVSNNHFDEDGLVGVYALVDPDGAQARRRLINDVAGAGDFGTYQSRDAARVSFALSSFADADRSPLDSSIFAFEYDDYAAAMYEELLPRLPELLDHPDRFRVLWEDEDARLAHSETALRSGTVTLDEKPEVDLAVVTIPEGWPDQLVHRFTQTRSQAIHPMAVHNTTDCSRVVLVEGRRYEAQFRYKTWVQYVSRKLPPRVDLEPLARELSQHEPAGQWHFDGASVITPRLHLTGAVESAIPPETFLERLVDFLRTSPSAWDPYDPEPGQRTLAS